MSRPPQFGKAAIPPHARVVRDVPGPHVAGVPTIDDEEPDVLRKVEAGVCPDWVEAETMVVRKPAVFFSDGEAAMEYFRRVHGRVYQNLSTARFWAARVRRAP